MSKHVKSKQYQLNILKQMAISHDVYFQKVSIPKKLMDKYLVKYLERYETNTVRRKFKGNSK